MSNKQHKYHEFIVQIHDGKIIEKMPTARKTVMIYDHEAERHNNTVNQTKFYYEKAEEEVAVKGSEELSNLEVLRQKAKELGIKGVHVMKEETLIEKINEKQ